AATAHVVSLELPEGLPPGFEVAFATPDIVVDAVLHRRSVRAAGFRVVTSDRVGADTPAPVPPVRTYRGRDRRDGAVQFAASLEDGGLYLTVRRGGGRAWFVQPLATVLPGAPPHEHVVYPDPGMPLDACGVAAGGVRDPRDAAGATTANPGIDVCEIAFDCDVEFYQAHQGSVPAVVAAVERTLDSVALMYEHEVTLTYRLTHVLVRTAEPDPYDGNDANAILDRFRAEWNTNQAGVHRDVAHFMTTRTM